jgi:hypothetical protein
MSRAIRNGSIVAAIVAITVAGCGSSSKPPKPALTEPQQVEHVLRSYLSAQTSGDGQTACALLTDSAQRQLETVVLQAAKGLLPSRPSCQEAVAAVKAFAPADLLAALSKAQIGQVQVQGDHATAEISGGTVFGKEHVSLERSDGTWKITGVPGLHV